MDYDIYISHDSDDIFYVRVCDIAGTETVHRVSVSSEQLRDLGVGNIGTHRILQHAFLFLLEREAPEAILKEFSLPDVTQHYPEFPQAIKQIMEKQ